ncbi:MAG: 1-deoxy-D-xylulose-5-phosphate synthase [Brevinema sp.]
MNKYLLLDHINTPADLKKHSITQLEPLAQEIRHFLIDHISKTGGHLAPNLGTVELSLALHYVFNSPEDCFIWDVGHQCYTHKILTGRKNLFPSLRKKNGLSGYPSPSESVHDIVHAGHSSTSLSLGVGIATAKKLSAENSKVIAIIGDGSFTNGMVYEALNDASWRQIPLLIILNDNTLSISENVGGIAKHFNTLRTNHLYLSLKKEISQGLLHSKIGKIIFQVLFACKSLFKKLIFKKPNFFENLGIKYFGPFDGHNTKQLISLFKGIDHIQEPILVHILTEKGRGHQASQENPINFHGISGNDDSISLSPKKGKSWSSIFGDSVCRVASQNQDIVVLTAAMREGTGLSLYAQQYPERFIDVGIAEQHAVTCAAGLALKGKKPIVAIYSTFLQRAYDQIIHDVAIAEYPVIFCLDRAGLVPGDGKTHQGIFDIAYLRTIPNMIIMSPINEAEFNLMLDTALIWDKPTTIRYPKDIAPHWGTAIPNLILGQGVILSEGLDGVIVIFGALLTEALETKQVLQKSGKDFAIYHLRFAKPIHDTVIEYLKNKTHIIIIEEGIATGGIGEYLSSRLPNQHLDLYNTGDRFPDTDTRESLLKDFGFNPTKIAQNALRKYQ